MCVYAPWYALAPVIARDDYGSAGVFGLLESIAGVGAVIGAVLALRWRPRCPLRAGLLLVLAWPVQDAPFALGAPLELVAVLAFATGFGFSLMVIWWETALARHIPPRRALAREQLRLDGLAGAAAARLRARRTAGRRARRASTCCWSAAGSGC